MNDQPNTPRPSPRKILKPRRLALLASAAGLSLALLAAGPGGYLPFNLPAFTSSAHAAETAPNAPGFADLVAKVKPAVISVRVKIDGDAENGAVDAATSGCESDQSGSPFDQF